MKEPVVVAPKFQSFSSHIFSQASQNVTVEVRVGRSVRTNKFTANSPLHVEKTMGMLFVELRTCCPFLLLVIVVSSTATIVALFLVSSTATIVALFLDHNRKSNFHDPL
jgi:hypothetical protein